MSGRTIVRWAVRVAGLLLVVALAVLLVLRLCGNRRLAAAERRFAAAVGPVQGDPYASPRVADEDNAAIYLRAGSEAMILPGNDRPHMGEMTMIPLGQWTSQNSADLKRILANNGPALDLLHRAGVKTRVSFGAAVWDRATHELTAPPLLKLITAQRLLFLDARGAALAHEPARLLADAASMARMAAGLEGAPDMVELLIGLACEKILLNTVREAVSDPTTDRETLATLNGMLMDPDLRTIWRRAGLAQKATIEQHVAAVLSDPHAARGERTSLYGRLMEIAFGDIFRAQQLELRADLMAVVDQPLGLNPQLLERGRDRPRWAFDVFETVIFPPGVQSAGRVQSTMSARNVARIALALRLRGFETGAYPETLASFPGAMVPDPFAGKPLTYERRADGSARISVPGFEELWKQISDASASSQPFLWELPPPRRTPTPTR